jgi:hypothetical protein
MKHLLLAIATLFCSSTFAQIEKGTWVGGTNLSISYYQFKNKSYQDKSFGFGFGPNFGKAIAKNLVLGGILSYNLSRHQQEYFNLQNIYPFENFRHSIGPTAFLKKYLMKGRFGGFGMVSLSPGYTYEIQKIANPNLPIEKRKNYTHGLNASVFLSVGLTYFITENWAIELQYGRLGYGFNKQFSNSSNDEGGSETHNFIAGFTPDNLFFNIRYYFFKKSS